MASSFPEAERAAQEYKDKSGIYDTPEEQAAADARNRARSAESVPDQMIRGAAEAAGTVRVDIKELYFHSKNRATPELTRLFRENLDQAATSGPPSSRREAALQIAVLSAFDSGAISEDFSNLKEIEIEGSGECYTRKANGDRTLLKEFDASAVPLIPPLPPDRSGEFFEAQKAAQEEFLKERFKDGKRRPVVGGSPPTPESHFNVVPAGERPDNV